MVWVLEVKKKYYERAVFRGDSNIDIFSEIFSEKICNTYWRLKLFFDKQPSANGVLQNSSSYKLKLDPDNHVFSCEICEIFKSIFFTKQLRWLLLKEGPSCSYAFVPWIPKNQKWCVQEEIYMLKVTKRVVTTICIDVTLVFDC